MVVVPAIYVDKRNFIGIFNSIFISFQRCRFDSLHDYMFNFTLSVNTELWQNFADLALVCLNLYKRFFVPYHKKITALMSN